LNVTIGRDRYPHFYNQLQKINNNNKLHTLDAQKDKCEKMEKLKTPDDLGFELFRETENFNFTHDLARR
jgi:hypothetical protein